ncbi:MAG: alcohol dehydrogenase catalytic domain-containing protein [Candidatus Gastranaerophilaceae bacterium]|jgi:threonine dehydrogenase-like Zn-dependent dehydrogenase
MKALVFDNELKIDYNYLKPIPQKGEALIKISMAGLCNTDLEITKGYMGFKGIPGHEFVGIVEEINSDDKSLIGKRVVGEINCGCGNCYYCHQNMQRHCPNRQTLGIFQKDGCFADYITIPVENIFEIPSVVTDEEAVFVEPVAAALEILEQVHIKPADKIAVLGDGKLGLLIAFVLSTTQGDLTLIGKHSNKLEIAEKQGIKTALLQNVEIKKDFDIVVDATGSINGLEIALSLIKPRGILVLKSTVASDKPLNLAPVVIDEITIVGSRCGQFKPALRLLEKKQFDIKSLITSIYPFEKALEAFEINKRKDSLKVLIEF